MIMNKAITKSEFFKELADELNISSVKAQSYGQQILESLEYSLSREHKIEIRKFGCFHMRVLRTRTIRNPKTGNPIIIKADIKVVRFKPSKSLFIKMQ
jgi:nucleoid DNA-binding protein